MKKFNLLMLVNSVARVRDGTSNFNINISHGFKTCGGEFITCTKHLPHMFSVLETEIALLERTSHPIPDELVSFTFFLN